MAESASPTHQQQQQQQQQQQPQPDDDTDAIPPLNCISAAMFVPIDTAAGVEPTTTLLTPLPPLLTREDRQRAAIAVINDHEAHVRNNLQALFRRELLRLTRDGEAQEIAYEAQKAELTGGADEGEQHSALVDHMQRMDVTNMVVNMATPHDPAVDYNYVDIPQPGFVDPVSSPREWTSNELMKVISSATNNLCGFDKQVASMRDAVLRKDQEKEAE